MRAKRQRPELRLELGPLGTVDPFRLAVVEHPAGSGDFCLERPGRRGARVPVGLASLNLAGAGQALLALAMLWMERSGPGPEPAANPFGEVRMVLRRREARLLAALLRRHLQRLPQPPGWMPELLVSLDEIDQFLRWEEAVPRPGEDEGP